MKKNYLIWIAFLLALVPVALLGSSIVGYFAAYISGLPIYEKVVFFNIVFFLFPVISVILGSIGYRKNKLASIFSIVLSLLVIIWYAIHLVLD